MNKKWIAIILAIVIVVVGGIGGVVLLTGKSSGDALDGTPVTLLTTGWVNSGINEGDPYRKWINDNYGLNVNLVATADFANDATVLFAGNSKPDIVVFPDMTTFRAQDSRNLISDWTPYLDMMPNMKKVIEQKDADNPNGDSIAKKMLTDEDGKLKALWTLPDSPTWSLKIREDWAEEYRATTTAGANYPAGNVASTDPETGEQVPWQPYTPDDLLNFARWIKATKPNCYGFTSAGSNQDFGTLGTWLPLMWGPVNIMPWGVYINDENEVDFGILNGNHKKMLDYLQTICDEELIDPKWYEQKWADKTKTQQGLIGIEWYPGAISEETESYNKDKDGSTINWWKTYDVPKDPDSPMGGYMPIEGYIGKIITVSKQASLDAEKMEKICKLINDVTYYYDETAEGRDKYQRPVAYDALRWGIGVEDGLKFQEIEGTDYLYINTKSPDENSGDVTGTAGAKYYRESVGGTGAWDWGAWFSSTSDGVVQGSSDTVSDVTIKVVEHNLKTATMKTRAQIGAALNLNASAVKNITDKMQSFEYKYVKRQLNSSDFEREYTSFVDKWRNEYKGDTLMLNAKEQFEELGLLTA